MANEQVIDYLRRFLGIPYIYAGNNPVQGFDCSGLVCEGLKFAGILKNHDDLSAQALFLRFNGVAPEVYPFRTGALVFFGTRAKVVHVGMVTFGGRMIEAGGGNENTRTADIAASRNAFVRERPILSRSDLVASYMPPYFTDSNHIA